MTCFWFCRAPPPMFLDLCLQNLNPQPPGLINAPIYFGCTGSGYDSAISRVFFPCFVSPRITLRWCNPIFFWNWTFWFGNMWEMNFCFNFECWGSNLIFRGVTYGSWVRPTRIFRLVLGLFKLYMFQIVSWWKVAGAHHRPAWLRRFPCVAIPASLVGWFFLATRYLNRAVLDMDQGLRTQKPQIWVTGLQ